MPNDAYRIDIHHHFWVPKQAETRGIRNESQRVSYENTPEKAIADMDAGGVAMALLSSTMMSTWFGDDEHYRTMTRESNDWGAQIVRDHPDRFGLMAGLPLRNTEDSLKEIEHAYEDLKADGITLYTSYEDKWLGDPSFWPVFEELNRREAVVYIHPYSAACCRNLIPDVSDGMIEYGTDTTRAIASVIFSGCAATYPNIRWIFSHGGGTMPYLYGRFASAARNSPLKERVPNGVLHELQKMFYDTAQASLPMTLACLTRLIPMSQIVFGSDYPYRPTAEYVRLHDEYGFSDADQREIGCENMLRILPHLRAHIPAAAQPA